MRNGPRYLCNGAAKRLGTPGRANLYYQWLIFLTNSLQEKLTMFIGIVWPLNDQPIRPETSPQSKERTF
jgi:hypothetical protein